MEIEQVKRYVASSLICSVGIGHSWAVALLGATVKNQGGARQGLFVMSILFGVLTIGAVRLLNHKSLLTPWFLGALVGPVVVYVYWFQIRG